MVARPSGVLSRHRGFQNIGLSSPVFTVENSAANNPIHTTHTKSVHTTCVMSNPKHSLTARPTELHNVKPVQV